MIEAPAQELRLVSMSGPTVVSLALKPPGPLIIGRRATHQLELPDRLVSRDHARLAFRPVGTDAGSTAGEWTLIDLGSKHGTRVNGRQLSPDEPMPLRSGDIITIAPWIFRIDDVLGGSRTTVTALATDEGRPLDATIVPLQPRGVEVLAQQRLTLLLKCAEELHRVDSETTLARVVLDAAVAGTGFANAAMLYPIEEDDRVSIIGHRGANLAGNSGLSLSRSLVRQACRGEPVRLSQTAQNVPTTHSIVELAIEEALCVPIVLESVVVLLLYLDDRAGGGRRSSKTSDIAEFALGLARVAGLALANLRRLDVERRQAKVEAELRAAAEVQRWVMPRREVRSGTFRCIGESRPGQFLGGDFFDAIPLDGGRLAVALGDVSGKGVAASVLVTVSQGFLHAALRRTGDPAHAVTELNQYLCPRCPEGKFLTLWVGLFDAAAQSVTFVDAGHGYALLALPGKAPEAISGSDEGDELVGINPQASYQARTLPLPTNGRVFIISDGLIEQPKGETDADEHLVEGDPFGLTGVSNCLNCLSPGTEPLAALYEAIHRHAGSPTLADDATALLIEW